MTYSVNGEYPPLLWARVGALALVTLVGACSSGPEKPKPTELEAAVSLLGVRQIWTTRTAEIQTPMSPIAVGGRLVIAGSDGSVAALDPDTGNAIWQGGAGEPVSAGVGSDGRIAALVTRQNQLVVFEAGKELWRQRLSSQVVTAPLVAGGRVFVLAGDRTASAYDAASGHRLWSIARPGDPLLLRQPGILTAVGDTLVAGFSGRLIGLNPSNGSTRWEAPIASPRGTNDIERLVDLVGPFSREGNSICVRAFQTAIGCVDASRGNVQWTRSATGFAGIHGNDTTLFGTESDGRVIAWRRQSGERLWSVDRLKHRGLTAPLALGRSVVVGDSAGMVHFLSRDDGTLLNRLSTDGSPIVVAPLRVGETLVVVTRNGGVFGFRPQ